MTSAETWPSRLGVYCDDQRAWPLLRVCCAQGQALRVVRGLRNLPEEIAHWPQVAYCDDWHELLADPACTEVLVGGSDESLLRAARHLAQAGKTVWLLPTPAQGLMFAYEVSLQLAEGQGLMVPLFPLRAEPVWQQLLGKSAASLRQEVQYLELERCVETARLDPADVAQRLLWDLDLLAQFLGPFHRVTTLRIGDERGGWQQTVTLSGAQTREAVWTIRPAQPGQIDRLTLRTATSTWQLSFATSGDAVWLTPAPACLEMSLLRAPRDVWFPRQITAEAWRDAVTSFELADAVEHSWERRRTIDLHHEPISERTIFKTQMVQAGCGVLLLTLLLLIGYLVLASTVPLGEGVLRVLRVLVFAPLMVYLVAQLLLPLSRDSRPS